MNSFLYSMILGGVVIVSGYIIMAASWHDIRSTAQRTRLAAAVRRLRGNHQPLVAILIDTHQASASDLTASLNSIVKSRYQQFSICVIDTQPTPVLKQYMATYSKRHPSRSIRHYVPRRPLSLSDAFRLAYRRAPKHDLLLTLSAGDTVHPATIKHAVAHLSINPRLGVLKLAHRSHLTYSLTSLLMRYMESSNELLQEAAPHLPHRTPSRIQTGILYRHGYFMAHKQHTARRTRYDSSLVITGHNTSLTAHPRYPIVIWLLSAGVIYLLTYAFIVTATLQSSSLLLLTWVSICAWTLTALWLESATSLREKFTLMYSILLAPLLVYFQAVLEVVLLPTRALGKLMRQWHRTRYNTYRDRYQRYVLDNILALKAWYEWMYPSELRYQDQRRTDD